MKNRSSFLLLPVLLLLSGDVFAQDAAPTGGDDPFRKVPAAAAPKPAPPPEAPPLKLVFESYSLDPMLARDVLVKDGPLKAYARAKELAQGGQAKFAQSIAVVTRSGQRAKIEEIRELRYPTEWDLPQLTLPKEKPGEGQGKPKPKSKKPDEKAADATSLPGLPTGDEFICIEDPTPTAFETRNVGLTIEIDPILRGGVCNVPIAVEITRHLGDREVAPGTKIVQPTFETRRFSLRSTLPMGAPSLLGTLNGPGETGAPDEDVRQPATLAFVTVSSNEAPRPEDAAAELPAGAFVAVIEVYSMAPQQALETSKAHGEECMARALALASTGEAKLEEILAVRGLATELIRTATRHEFKYATEWEPARLSPMEAKKWPQVPAIFSLPIPTSMETRDIGTDAQITLAPLKEGVWSANANIETVRLVRQQETPRGSHILQPVFETRKLIAGIEAPVGKPTLLGSFSAQSTEEDDAKAAFAPLVGRIAEPKERDRSWLAFITVHGAAVAPPPKPLEVADLTLPKLILERASVAEAAAKLEILSREVDPTGAGVKIELPGLPANDGTRVTLSLGKVSLVEAVKYLGSISGRHYALNGNRFTLVEGEPDRSWIGTAKPQPIVEFETAMPGKSSNHSRPDIARPIATQTTAQPLVPSQLPVSQLPVSTAPQTKEKIETQYYDLDSFQKKLPDQNQWRNYLTTADIAFPSGSTIGRENEYVRIDNTRANLERIEALLGIQPSTKMVLLHWPAQENTVDLALLEEVPRPEALADPIPAKVWSCRKQLEAGGVPFPEGSFAVYLRNSKQLYVKNTMQNMARVGPALESTSSDAARRQPPSR